MKRYADECTIEYIMELRREIKRLEEVVESYKAIVENPAIASYELYIENKSLKRQLIELKGQ